MNATSNPTTANLRDALYELSVAPSAPDADLLDKMIRAYPQFASELTDFAIELVLDARFGDSAFEAESSVDTNCVSPVVSRALSRFHNRLHTVRQVNSDASRSSQSLTTVENPFASLKRDEFRAFAKRIGANSAFVVKLRDRQIKSDTITDRFLELVSSELPAPMELVAAHFAASRTSATTRQFLKSDGKPTDWAQQTFEEAVRSSGLDEEQQRRLLSL